MSYRPSYEAHVLVVPLGESGDATVEEMSEAGLAGVTVLRVHRTVDGRAATYLTAAIGAAAPASETARPLADVASGADVVVFVASKLDEVSQAYVRTVADAARAAGLLLAAVTVGSALGSSTANMAMAGMRTEVDMLVSVRRAALAAAFLDVVRGGVRERTGV